MIVLHILHRYVYLIKLNTSEILLAGRDFNWSTIPTLVRQFSNMSLMSLVLSSSLYSVFSSMLVTSWQKNNGKLKVFFFTGKNICLLPPLSQYWWNILSQKGDNSFKYGLIKVMHKYAILQMLIRDHAKFYGNQF